MNPAHPAGYELSSCGEGDWPAEFSLFVDEIDQELGVPGTELDAGESYTLYIDVENIEAGEYPQLTRDQDPADPIPPAMLTEFIFTNYDGQHVNDYEVNASEDHDLEMGFNTNWDFVDGGEEPDWHEGPTIFVAEQNVDDPPVTVESDGSDVVITADPNWRVDPEFAFQIGLWLDRTDDPEVDEWWEKQFVELEDIDPAEDDVETGEKYTLTIDVGEQSYEFEEVGD